MPFKFAGLISFSKCSVPLLVLGCKNRSVSYQVAIFDCDLLKDGWHVGNGVTRVCNSLLLISVRIFLRVGDRRYAPFTLRPKIYVIFGI